jgi:predicted secreted protein
MLLWKVLATTILAAIIFAGVYLYFGVYEMTLEDLPV